MDETPTVGFIGLGIMGTPMAGHLLEAGYPLVVHDVRPERVERLEADGADGRSSPAAIADDADVVLTSLPRAEHVREVALGDSGLVEGDAAGLVLVDLSTVGPTAIRSIGAELESAGVTTIDAPVSGGEVGAKAATLTVMVGCDGDLPSSVADVLEVLGDRLVRMGGLGAGQVAKVCNNMVAASTMVSLAEALVFAEKAGVSRANLLDAMAGSTADGWIRKNQGENLLERDFEPGFFGSYVYKDLSIAARDAEEFGAPIPLGSQAHELYKSVVETGRGDLDAGVVLAVVEELAGIDPGV